MKVLISAAEASSDAHGAGLLRALQEKAPTGVEIDAFGIGGPKLSEAGLRVVVDTRQLLAMGFSELFGRIFQIIGALRSVSRAAEKERPDVAVLIDYPDFHFLLARRLKRLGIPVIYFIPPKVWAWRRYRVRAMKRIFTKVLCILPFEEEFYRQNGITVKYVGNPLVDELPLKMSRGEARQKLGLDPYQKVVTLMPGSRPHELERHTPLLLDSIALTVSQLGKPLTALMPLPETVDHSTFGAIEKQVQAWLSRASEQVRSTLKVKISKGDAALALLASDAALIKSGTSTLEAGLLGCPHVLFYQASRTTWWLFKNIIRYRGPIGLVNLVSGTTAGSSYLIPEYLMESANPERLSGELLSLLTDPTRRNEMISGLLALRERVLGDAAVREGGPSMCAATEVLETVSASACARH
jgi:lipid-A-disaccharide synthase